MIKLLGRKDKGKGKEQRPYTEPVKPNPEMELTQAISGLSFYMKHASDPSVKVRKPSTILESADHLYSVLEQYKISNDLFNLETRTEVADFLKKMGINYPILAKDFFSSAKRIEEYGTEKPVEKTPETQSKPKTLDVMALTSDYAEVPENVQQVRNYIAVLTAISEGKVPQVISKYFIQPVQKTDTVKPESTSKEIQFYVEGNGIPTPIHVDNIVDKIIVETKLEQPAIVQETSKQPEPVQKTNGNGISGIRKEIDRNLGILNYFACDNPVDLSQVYESIITIGKIFKQNPENFKDYELTQANYLIKSAGSKFNTLSKSNEEKEDKISCLKRAFVAHQIAALIDGEAEKKNYENFKPEYLKRIKGLYSKSLNQIVEQKAVAEDVPEVKIIKTTADSAIEMVLMKIAELAEANDEAKNSMALNIGKGLENRLELIRTEEEKEGRTPSFIYSMESMALVGNALLRLSSVFEGKGKKEDALEAAWRAFYIGYNPAGNTYERLSREVEQGKSIKEKPAEAVIKEKPVEVKEKKPRQLVNPQIPIEQWRMYLEKTQKEMRSPGGESVLAKREEQASRKVVDVVQSGFGKDPETSYVSEGIPVTKEPMTWKEEWEKLKAIMPKPELVEVNKPQPQSTSQPNENSLYASFVNELKIILYKDDIKLEDLKKAMGPASRLEALIKGQEEVPLDLSEISKKAFELGKYFTEQQPAPKFKEARAAYQIAFLLDNSPETKNVFGRTASMAAKINERDLFSHVKSIPAIPVANANGKEKEQDGQEQLLELKTRPEYADKYLKDGLRAMGILITTEKTPTPETILRIVELCGKDDYIIKLAKEHPVMQTPEMQVKIEKILEEWY